MILRKDAARSNAAQPQLQLHVVVEPVQGVIEQAGKLPGSVLHQLLVSARG